MVCISEKKLLETVVNAAQCFIPEDTLTDEQKDKLLSIRYHLCRCPTCRRVLTAQRNVVGTLGHANRLDYLVGISRDAVRTLMGTRTEGSVPIFLLEFIQTVLHETIHVLYPEYGEKETNHKTVEWLGSFDWEPVLNFGKPEIEAASMP